MISNFQTIPLQTNLCIHLNIEKMTKIKGTVVINTERCKGCDLCVKACPLNVLSLSNEANTKGYTYSYMTLPEACVGCAACAYVCPDACITVYKIKNDKQADHTK